jgi:putative effector of murein hydrolase LrgA (UPF0299 family)
VFADLGMMIRLVSLSWLSTFAKALLSSQTLLFINFLIFIRKDLK